MQVQLADKLRFLAHAGQRTLAQAALRFVLDAPAMSAVIPGIKTALQAEENLAASEGLPLTETERQAIQDVLEEALDDLL